MSNPPPDQPLHYVIGSGPSGMACAYALLQRGARVVMLDAGVSLEESRRDMVKQMSLQRPENWTREQLKFLAEGTIAGIKGIPRKLIYGSDYPYRETELHVPGDYDRVGIRPSLAQGGFSAVWGASVLPYSEKDMAGWAIGTDDLAKHYAAVAKMMNVSGVHDGLEKVFPLYQGQAEALALSRQAKIFLTQLENNRAALETAGIYFGQSRLAVKAGTNGCVYCRFCMYGCPYGFIYNSKQTLQELTQNAGFSYHPDVVVTQVHENGAAVRITGYHRVTREPVEFPAHRVYLAAGPLSTAKIVLQSLGLYDKTIRLKDSQYYLFPLVAQNGGDVRREAMHTLSQVFLEIFDPKVTPHSVHLQVYSYNDLIGNAVRRPFGPVAVLMEWLVRALERRLLIVQGYLHSDDSSKIAIRLKKGDPDRLQVDAELNPEARPVIRRVLAKLRRHVRQFDAWPLQPMLQVAEPGRGFHSGGSFPMRKTPAELETDILGRLPAWKNIHIVDSSVLPDIPATQITFTVMANAHRIASQTAKI